MFLGHCVLRHDIIPIKSGLRIRGQLVGLIVVLETRTGFRAHPSRGCGKNITTQMGQTAFWEEIFVALLSDPVLNSHITDVYQQRGAGGLALCPEALVHSL